MKKIAIIGILVLMLVSGVTAQTPSVPVTSPTAEPTVSAEEDVIQTLKDKVATKVAELRQDNIRAVSGTVEKVEGDTVTLKTEDNEDYTIKLDESLTKFYRIDGSAKGEIKREDIKKGNYAIVDGVINDRTVTANSVYLDVLYLVRVGRIIEVNAADFTIQVVGTDKETYTLDIETGTRQTILNTSTLQPERIGFSKIKENDAIHFVVQKTGEETEVNRYDAVKLLIIPQEYFIK